MGQKTLFFFFFFFLTISKQPAQPVCVYDFEIVIALSSVGFFFKKLSRNVFNEIKSVSCSNVCNPLPPPSPLLNRNDDDDEHNLWKVARITCLLIRFNWGRGGEEGWWGLLFTIFPFLLRIRVHMKERIFTEPRKGRKAGKKFNFVLLTFLAVCFLFLSRLLNLFCVCRSLPALVFFELPKHTNAFCLLLFDDISKWIKRKLFLAFLASISLSLNTFLNFFAL